MHDHEVLITRFYKAFQEMNGAEMTACYHPDATFNDEVFTLSGAEVGGMWSMLCERSTDLVIRFRDVKADDAGGTAHWDADYTFSTTGRFVNNAIDATFTFQDGLIRTHVDRFNFWAWSRMAIGVPGYLLGWTPILRNKVRGTAAKQLASFMRRKKEQEQGGD